MCTFKVRTRFGVVVPPGTVELLKAIAVQGLFGPPPQTLPDNKQ